MECDLLDIKKLSVCTEDQKAAHKEQVAYHPIRTKCDQCGELKTFLNHEEQNGAWKHVCCDCLHGRESWTDKSHSIQHQKALLIEIAFLTETLNKRVDAERLAALD